VAELATELWMVTYRDLRNTARVRAFFEVVGGGMSDGVYSKDVRGN
jgi:hypothetical protein